MMWLIWHASHVKFPLGLCVELYVLRVRLLHGWMPLQDAGCALLLAVDFLGCLMLPSIMSNNCVKAQRISFVCIGAQCLSFG